MRVLIVAGVSTQRAFARSTTKLVSPLRSDILPLTATHEPGVMMASHSLKVRGKSTTSMESEKSASLRNPIFSPFLVWLMRALSMNPAMTVSTPRRFSLAYLILFFASLNLLLCLSSG